VKEALKQQIQAAQAVVCFVGPTTATSSWIDWELAYAHEQAKTVICIRGDQADALPATVGSAIVVTELDTTGLAELIAG